ncbi:MAG: hypothetical protein KJS64_00735 [Acidobacteria bacterium]|nr:hypothetical protein [Acidobacteriota bacterium]
MTDKSLLVVSVPPGPNPWKVFFADAVGTDDEMDFICDLPSMPSMTASECVAIEDLLYANHSIVLTSPWRYEIEWWDADIEVVAPESAHKEQYRKRYAYRTVPEHVGDPVTVSLIHRPVYSSGMPRTEKLFVAEGLSGEQIASRLRDCGAELASPWSDVVQGRLQKARVALGRDFTEDFWLRP